MNNMEQVNINEPQIETVVEQQEVVNVQPQPPIVVNVQPPVPMQIQRILDWASGIWIPNTKQDEDNFLIQSANYIGINCSNNPGKLGEWIVNYKLGGNLPINQRIPCNWLLGQRNVCPDIGPVNNRVYEIKSLRYFNSNGGRGNQGTGSEKLDSIFRKYWNIPGEKIIVLVADQQFEKNGQMYLDAFNNNNFNNNGYLETFVPILQQNGFSVISFRDL